MEKEILEKLIVEGNSQRQLAEKLNCSQSNIKYWLKKLNLKTNHNVNNIRQGNTKICPICNVVKDLSYFYSRANRKDVAGYCKECSNTYHSNRVSSVKLKMID